MAIKPQSLFIISMVFLGITFGNPLGVSAQTLDDLSSKDRNRFKSILDKCIGAYNDDRFEKAITLCNQAGEIYAKHPAIAE